MFIEHLAKLGWLRDDPNKPIILKFEGKELELHALSPVDWTIIPDQPLERDVIFVNHLPVDVKESDLKSYFDEALNDEGTTVRTVRSIMIWPHGRALVFFESLDTEQTCDNGLFA